MSFEDIVSKEMFKAKICVQCKLCNSELTKADFCFVTFIANRRMFVDQFVYKVIYAKGVTGDAACMTFRRADAFKLAFCLKPGACLRAGSCSSEKREECYSKYYNQITGMDFSLIKDDDLDAYGIMLGEMVPQRTTDAFLDYMEENRTKAKRDAEEVLDAEFEELTGTTKDEPEDGPMVLSSERKKFLRTVEGILENRDSQQYRIRKSPKPLKAKAAGQTNNSKSTVSVSCKRRKKDVGDSKADKSS